MISVFWVVLSVVGIVLVDRILLWAEARGWLYYRRSKLARGAGTYHLLEWNSAFDPTMRQVQEEMIREEREDETSGEPPISDSGETED